MLRPTQRAGKANGANFAYMKDDKECEKNSEEEEDIMTMLRKRRERHEAERKEARQN